MSLSSKKIIINDDHALLGASKDNIEVQADKLITSKDL